MDRETYDTYIDRFNRQDATAFEDYLCEDMEMLNGGLRFKGIEGMKNHYQTKIWPYFIEDLNVLRFVGNDERLAIEMRAEFMAIAAFEETIFGPVAKGERFTFHGLLMYELEGGKFKTIQCAYNSFINTQVDGSTRDIGMPH